MQRMTPVVRFVLAALVLVLISPTSPSARTWYIEPDGSGDAPTIQAGVDSAAVGDTVLVAPGVYHDCTHLNAHAHPHCVILRGGIHVIGEADDPSDVVIDAEGVGRVIECTNLAEPVCIRGITIARGRTNMTGGGLYAHQCHLFVDDCRFVRNESSDASGGGIRAAAPYTLQISGCQFSSNAAPNAGLGQGGAVSVTASGDVAGLSYQIVDCVFQDNTAGYGGGAVHLRTAFPNSMHVIGCKFSGNSTEGYGGAVLIDYYGSAEIRECLFVDNRALKGGAMAAYYVPDESEWAYVDGCTFERNMALAGGAVWLWRANVRCTGSMYVHDWADDCGGVFDVLDGGLAVLDCTLHGNGAGGYAGGIAVRHSLFVLARTIISYSTSGEAVYRFGPLAPTIQCCDLCGNAGGDWVGTVACYAGIEGNFSEDPVFCDRENGDFHLAENSPCMPENKVKSRLSCQIMAWSPA
jgi:hypothetical protein